MKIPKLLNSKIHKKAHAAGVAHAGQMALRLQDEVRSRIDAGESIGDICAYLAENDPPQSRTSDCQHTD